MDVSAKITGIKYSPLLCKDLRVYPKDNFDVALSKEGTFILKIDEKRQIAVSWWVSAKRTRSYPYARVYDSLNFQGKKVTIIPFVKDEGKEGDRDFLQWDTVSLMSLLGIYVIISYYSKAEKSSRYEHKITKQRFDMSHIRNEIYELLSYQSDALHWNVEQIEKIGIIGRKALDSYKNISEILGIKMHSMNFAERRLEELLKGKQNFMILSRDLAQKAQNRESLTNQPKEMLSGSKAILTIKNYLGGNYFLTSDELEINQNNVLLIECKHSKQSLLPSLGDIKDGLIKMILFTNLKDVTITEKKYTPIAVLKLTSSRRFVKENLRRSQFECLRLLKKEAETNCFQIVINNTNLKDINL